VFLYVARIGSGKRVRILMYGVYLVRKTCLYFQPPSPKIGHNMTEYIGASLPRWP